MDYLSKEANEISDLVTGGVGVIASAVKNTLVTTMKEITEWPIIRVIYINDQEGSENGIQLWGSEELSKKRRIETHFPNLILLADGLYAFDSRSVPERGFKTWNSERYTLDWESRRENPSYYLKHGVWAAERIQLVKRGCFYR